MHDCNHILKKLATSFAEALWPTRCVGCEEPGALLCERCAARLERIDQRLACPRCGAPFGHIVCTQCPAPGAVARDGQPLPAPFSFAEARAATGFTGIARDVVHAYKDGGERRLAGLMADEVACALRGGRRPALQDDVAARAHGACDWTGALDRIVPVPCTPQALRRRGFDHVGLVAEELAGRLGLPRLAALRTRKSADQRELSAEARRRNKRGSFSACADVAGMRVLLLDDVMTTGATASAAADALLACGAQSVRVAVFSRVW